MKYLTLEKMEVSQLALGCMRLAKLSQLEANKLINTAIELGINFFDHADIYGQGECETIFGNFLAQNPKLRSKIFIQTKCGICKGYYDLSYEHIINSVENSLKRLKTDYIDILLLHRPDALMDPKEIARAFNDLKNSGKVRYFGISNMTPSQHLLLKRYIEQPILINQLQFNVVNATMIESGINANMNNTSAIDHDGYVLDYCRLNDILIQPWSILQASWEKGSFLDHDDYQELNIVLQELAQKYHLSKAAISLAWILRHPANMQPIAGTTSCKHLEDLIKAFDIELTNQEWYRLYLAVGRQLP